nr:photosystem II CP43 reaction center protein [Ipomoea batatas]
MLGLLWEHPPALDPERVGEFMQRIRDQIFALEERKRALLQEEQALIVQAGFIPSLLPFPCKTALRTAIALRLDAARKQAYSFPSLYQSLHITLVPVKRELLSVTGSSTSEGDQSNLVKQKRSLATRPRTRTDRNSSESGTGFEEALREGEAS